MSASRSDLRSHQLAAVLLIAGAALGLVANPLHPHSVESGDAVVQSIAQSDIWVGVHLAIIVAILLVSGGLVGLAHLLAIGPSGPLARLGLAAALVGSAVVAVSTAIDGFAMKVLARTWSGAPAAEAASVLRLAIAVRDVDFAVWSVGMLVFFGAAFICFGAAAAADRRFPTWFGWIAVNGGLGSSVAALLQIVSSGEVQAAETLFFGSSALLTVWLLALGAVLWRTPAPTPAAGGMASLQPTSHRDTKVHSGVRPS